MGVVFQFSWPVSEQERVSQFLLAHIKTPSDMRQVWKNFAIDLRSAHARTFDAMANPITRMPWTPLDPKYAATKPPGTQSKILYRTGRLRKSLTVPKSPGSLFVSQPRYMIYGTTVPYSVFHQTTSRTRKDGASLNRVHVGMAASLLKRLAKWIKRAVVNDAIKAARAKKGLAPLPTFKR